MVTRHSVGDHVVITPANIQAMQDSNRSCCHPNYPCDSFIALAKKHVGIVGTVTHTFPPGYEVTAEFDGQAFHMRDYWITAT